MSWVEVSKINSNFFESLDALIKKSSARKMKTIQQSITATRSTITSNKTIVNVKGAGIFKRIYLTGAVRTNDTTANPNYYVHPGSLKIDGQQRYSWSGAQQGVLNSSAYINHLGVITAWTASNGPSVAGSPFYNNTAAYGSWPNIYAIDLDWHFTEGFSIDLTALDTPTMGGTGTSVFSILYDLEVNV